MTTHLFETISSDFKQTQFHIRTQSIVVKLDLSRRTSHGWNLIINEDKTNSQSIHKEKYKSLRRTIRM